MSRLFPFIILVALLTQIVSCGHKGIYARGYYSGREVVQPVVEHVVSKGETLYSLAWQHGYDYREVAKWNEIPTPYTIFPGQKLRIKPTRAELRLANGNIQRRDPAKRPVAKVQGDPVSTPKREPVRKHLSKPVKISWIWPTSGKVINTFSNNDPGRKGIDISGKSGQAVTAAAEGTVVYKGSGLRGYGKLIIVKHDETFFSAYAHNRAIVVKEGQSVKKGERIADMGSTGTDRVKLHFEIRRNGVPVNPFYYLPKQ